jgi:hypothetical protein
VTSLGYDWTYNQSAIKVGAQTEVCELFSTQFCSSKEVIQLQRKNVMAFKISKVC